MQESPIWSALFRKYEGDFDRKNGPVFAAPNQAAEPLKIDVTGVGRFAGIARCSSAGTVAG